MQSLTKDRHTVWKMAFMSYPAGQRYSKPKLLNKKYLPIMSCGS